MWQSISIIILVIEIILATIFLYLNFKKIKSSLVSIIFVCCSFLVSFTVYLVPYLYETITNNSFINGETNLVFDFMNLVKLSIEMFVFGLETDAVYSFTVTYPIYTFVYLLAAVIAVSATITTAIYIFRNKLINYFKTRKLLKGEYCDILIGYSSSALKYCSKESKSIIWLSNDVSKEIIHGLHEKGICTISKNLNSKTLNSKIFNSKTKYNFIYFNEDNNEDFVDYVNLFKEFFDEQKLFNYYLHLEAQHDKAEVIKEEIIDKVNYKSNILTFNRYELLCRELVEEYPLTKYIPSNFICKDTTLNSSKKINVFLLGFGSTHQELLKQLLLNNQFATVVNDTYETYQINYFIYDKDECTQNVYHLNGIKHRYERIKKHSKEYFDLPNPVGNVKFINCDIKSSEVIDLILNSVEKKNSYTFIYNSFGDSYNNVNFTEILLRRLHSYDSYHIFAKVKDKHICCSNEKVTNYGDLEDVLNHDIIVNDNLTKMAKAMFAGYSKLKEDRPLKDIQREINDRWTSLDTLSLESNTYAALNIRTKLNLLGLDYEEKGETTNKVIDKPTYFKKYLKINTKAYKSLDEYISLNQKNALIAQEHARWNAFHLINDFVPMKIKDIKLIKKDGIIKFKTKDLIIKEHACLTSYKGLKELSLYLLNQCNSNDKKKHNELEFDYYQYDLTTIINAFDILDVLGYQIIEK